MEEPAFDHFARIRLDPPLLLPDELGEGEYDS
jgi:hypothetical protein